MFVKYTICWRGDKCLTISIIIIFIITVETEIFKYFICTQAKYPIICVVSTGGARTCIIWINKIYGRDKRLLFCSKSVIYKVIIKPASKATILPCFFWFTVLNTIENITAYEKSSILIFIKDFPLYRFRPIGFISVLFISSKNAVSFIIYIWISTFFF